MRLSTPIFVLCGIWRIGLGLYFALLRPALLPEDPRYIGTSLAEIQAAVPGLERWLRRVFTVMGGFVAASGVLTMHLAMTAGTGRRKGAGAVFALVGLLTVATMSWTNFQIGSDFRWLLLVPALLWLAGMVIFFRFEK